MLPDAKRRATHLEITLGQNIHGPLPFGIGRVFDGAGDGNARIAHQDVNAAVGQNHVSHGPIHGFRVRHVAAERNGAARAMSPLNHGSRLIGGACIYVKN